ncbi:MAG: glycosyltransferase family 2 protein [Planctomycetota bacterium]
MVQTVLVYAVFGLAALPFGLVMWNLLLYRRLPRVGSTVRDGGLQGVSVLIPARDEAEAIGPAVRSVLANTGVELEVVVLDDESTDGTAAVVRGLMAEDDRVRLERSTKLPEGWCGKQHACYRLAGLAKHEVLCWIDADVRLEPWALSAMAAELERGGADLISGFPRQRTDTLAERLIVHLIPLVLLCYLPLWMMRRKGDVGFGAGCGQLFMAKAEAYRKSGGHSHEMVRGSLHDGVTLPRAMRSAGFKTDLFDAVDLASCKMYTGWGQVWRGFAKNATEGMATPVGLPAWTVLLLGGHVLPFVLMGAWLSGGLGLGVGGGEGWVGLEQLVMLSFAMSGVVSVGLAWRFSQGWTAGLLRPMGVCVLVAIQWYALVRKWRGLPPVWRGRAVGGV